MRAGGAPRDVSGWVGMTLGAGDAVRRAGESGDVFDGLGAIKQPRDARCIDDFGGSDVKLSKEKYVFGIVNQ